MSVGVRYVHKWIDYAIEAVCELVAGGEACGVNNPGFGTGENIRSAPACRRSRSGARLRRARGPAPQAAGEPLVGSTPAICSATCAATGRASPAPTKRSAALQPYSGRSFNLLYYSYDAHGNASYGPLGTDRPHQFKAAGHLRHALGHDGRHERARRERRAALDGREREGHDVLSQRPRRSRTHRRRSRRSTCSLQQDFRLTGTSRVSLGVNITNLFDQDTATALTPSPRIATDFNLAGSAVLWRVRSGSGGGGDAELPARRALPAWPAAIRTGGRSGCRRSSRSNPRSQIARQEPWRPADRHGSEVPEVEGRDRLRVQPFGSGHDDGVHEADAKRAVTSRDLARARQIRFRPHSIWKAPEARSSSQASCALAPTCAPTR